MLELKAEMDGLMYRTKDQLRIQNDDHAMSILRYYKWSSNDIMNAFATPPMIQQAYKDIGIVYDKTLKLKFPDIDNSMYINNDNKCLNCNTPFIQN